MPHILRKPDLSDGEGGWIDPAFLAPAERQELTLLLAKSPLSDTQKSAFLEFCNDMAQCMDEDLTPLADQLAEIQAVEANARRLLASINAMSQPARAVLSAHADYLAYGSSPPVQLAPAVATHVRSPRGNLLSGGWDWVQSIELAASYSASKYAIDRQSKPAQLRARGFVSLLARYVLDTTGALPPKNRASWFAMFAERLGELTGLKIGPRIVESGICDVHLDRSKGRINVEGSPG